MKQSLKARHPLLFAYGDEQVFLTTEEAVAATREERIRSVWPFICRRVLEFCKTLKPRERACLDPEDALAEIWIELAQKDGKWEPERGKYITFVGTLVEHRLFALRDEVRTVRSPRNSSCRLKEYQAEQDAGLLSEKRAKTADDIRRSLGEFEPILQNDVDNGGDPSAEAEAEERKSLARKALIRALRSPGISPYEAALIGKSAGLWGQPAKTIAEISRESGECPDRLKRDRSRAFAKIRDRLRELGYHDAD